MGDGVFGLGPRKSQKSQKPMESFEIIQNHGNPPESWEPDICDCAGGAQEAWESIASTIENQPGGAGAAPRCPGSIDIVGKC